MKDAEKTLTSEDFNEARDITFTLSEVDARDKIIAHEARRAALDDAIAAVKAHKVLTFSDGPIAKEIEAHGNRVIAQLAHALESLRSQT